MSTLLGALVWVFAVGTCLCGAVILVTISLAIRHRRQITRAGFSILEEGQIEIPRSLVMADLLVVPWLGRELRRWVRVHGAGPVGQPPQGGIRGD
jgi:hypothetical protein